MNASTRLAGITVAGAAALYAGSVQAGCEDPLLDPTQVLDLHVRVTQAEWDALTDDVPSPDDVPECDRQYPYHEVEFRCGDDDGRLRRRMRDSMQRSGTTIGVVHAATRQKIQSLGGVLNPP